MTRRFAALAISTALVLTALALPAPAAAASSAPIPASMAAVGDSITQAASTGGSLGADAPQNSWSTGTSTTVNSHFLRLRTLNPSLEAHNRSVSGAKVGRCGTSQEPQPCFGAQIGSVLALPAEPGYVTVLIGGNDLCTSTEAAMTSVEEFRANFATAMSTLMTNTTNTYVYVTSIPDVYQLWSLFRNNFWARTVWAVGGVCQSLLANAGSTSTADSQRRLRVQQRNIAFNTQLREVCESYASRCRYDGNAVFNTKFTTNDVSGDYFHPSIAGQAKLASVSWGAGYTWTAPNQSPVASFTHSCDALVCSFTDTSSDADGTVVGWSWAFGDGATSATRHPSHTYGSDGTYAVTLTVTDNSGAKATTSRSVTVTAPPPPSDPPPSDPPPSDPPPSDPPKPSMSVGELNGFSSAGKGQAWTATVSIPVSSGGSAVNGAAVTGSWSTGASASCTTSAGGSCTVSINLNSKQTTSVIFSVTGASHSSYTWDGRAPDPLPLSR